MSVGNQFEFFAPDDKTSRGPRPELRLHVTLEFVKKVIQLDWRDAARGQVVARDQIFHTSPDLDSRRPPALAGDRLTAARAEHSRRRADQVARHEIRVQPHLDALLLVAEPAWQGALSLERARVSQTFTARFVTRSRRWYPT